MESFASLGSNLLSPPVIAFGAGMIAIWARSDLKFPAQVYQALTIYLLIAIGFKGGTAVASTSLAVLAVPLIATLVIGSIIPIGVFFAVKHFMKLKIADAAALAAHYGSVSAVTFMACLAFLDNQGVAYEAFMPAIMVTMEIPAIFVAMLLAKLFQKNKTTSLKASIHEVVSGKSFVLLICGLLSGIVAGAETKALIEPFLVTPFYGVLMLFLLEMGLVAGEKIKGARQVGLPLIVFAIASPCIQGIVALFLAQAIGLSQGGAVIFAVLSASASYIAAPAAVRASLPDANPGIYVTASLGITFPFNLVVGIPLFLGVSHIIY